MIHGKLDKHINVPDNNNILLVEEVFNMSRLIYPGSRKVEGPWLLDKTSLQTFEKMVNAIVAEFCNDSEKEYKAEYTITFSDGYSIFPFFFIGGFFSILSIFISRTSASQLYQNSLSPQIQSILEHGVDESNYMNALELLLTKECSYIPPSFEAKSNPTIYLLLILIFLIIAIVGFHCPKSNIAIGAGRKKVKFWKSYERFITISIPTLILLPLLENFISSFF